MSKYQTSVLALQLSGQDLKLQWIIRSEQPFAGSAKGLRDDPSTTYRPINGIRNLWVTKYAPYLVSTNRLSYDWNEVTQETMFCRAQYLDEGVRCGVSIIRRNWLLYTFADYQEGNGRIFWLRWGRKPRNICIYSVDLYVKVFPGCFYRKNGPGLEMKNFNSFGDPNLSQWVEITIKNKYLWGWFLVTEENLWLMVFRFYTLKKVILDDENVRCMKAPCRY